MTADRTTELGLFLVTVLAWALLAYVILVLPVSSSTQSIFYGSGFVAIAGTAALLSALYQTRAKVDGLRHRAVASLGAGMRFAFAVEFTLWLQSLRVLTAAYLVFIAAGFLLVEFLFRYANADRRGFRE